MHHFLPQQVLHDLVLSSKNCKVEGKLIMREERDQHMTHYTNHKNKSSPMRCFKRGDAFERTFTVIRTVEN